MFSSLFHTNSLRSLCCFAGLALPTVLFALPFDPNNEDLRNKAKQTFENISSFSLAKFYNFNEFRNGKNIVFSPQYSNIDFLSFENSQIEFKYTGKVQRTTTKEVKPRRFKDYVDYFFITSVVNCVITSDMKWNCLHKENVKVYYSPTGDLANSTEFLVPGLVQEFSKDILSYSLTAISIVENQN